LCTTYWHKEKGTDLKVVAAAAAVVVVVIVTFDSICHAEGFVLSLARGCDLIASLTHCVQQHPLKLSAERQLSISVYGLTREVAVQLHQAGFRETIVGRPS